MNNIDRITFFVLVILLFCAIFSSSDMMGALALLFSFLVAFKVIFSHEKIDLSFKPFQKALLIKEKQILIEEYIDGPKLWSYENPNLYHLIIEVGKGEQVLCVPVGFRKIEIKEQQFFLNDKPVKINGMNRLVSKSREFRPRSLARVPNSGDKRDKQVMSKEKALPVGRAVTVGD